jgi:hypothetical protein
MNLVPINAEGVRSPESAALSDEEFGKHVGMLKGWVLDENGRVYEENRAGSPLLIAGSLSELGRLLRMLPEPAVSAGRGRSSIFWTRIPEAAQLQHLSKGSPPR